MLRFTPYAWAKLLYFRDRGSTEIGGFGISDAADPLRIVEFATVKQTVSAVSVSFDDEAVADFFDQQVDAGRQPHQFARHWIHTHPGDCPEPSGTDEQTFARAFGSCDWACMFIIARRGRTYARLRFSAGPGGQVLIPVQVDYGEPFAASDQDAWEAEYQAHVQIDSSMGIADDGVELLGREIDDHVMAMLLAAEAEDLCGEYEEDLES